MTIPFQPQNPFISLFDMPKTEHKILISLYEKIDNSEHLYTTGGSKYLAKGIQMDERGKDIGNKQKYGCSTKSYDQFLKKYKETLLYVQKTKKKSGWNDHNAIALTKEGAEEARMLIDFGFKKDLFIKFIDDGKHRDKVLAGRLRHKERIKKLRKMTKWFSTNQGNTTTRNRELYNRNKIWFERNFQHKSLTYIDKEKDFYEVNKEVLAKFTKKLQKLQNRQEGPKLQNREAKLPDHERSKTTGLLKLQNPLKGRFNRGKATSGGLVASFLECKLRGTGRIDTDIIAKAIDSWGSVEPGSIKHNEAWIISAYDNIKRDLDKLVSIKKVIEIRRRLCKIHGGTWASSPDYLHITQGTTSTKFKYHQNEKFWESEGLGYDYILENIDDIDSKYKKYLKKRLTPITGNNSTKSYIPIDKQLNTEYGTLESILEQCE